MPLLDMRDLAVVTSSATVMGQCFANAESGNFHDPVEDSGTKLLPAVAA